MRRIVLALLACLGAAPALAQQPTVAVRIAEVRAQLFQERTGTFSNDLLGPNPPELGNVIIGDDPANAFLLVVTLEGPPRSFQRDAVLQVTVRSRGGRPAPYNRRARGFLFGESGRTNQAMLVHDHVCQPVEIDIRIGRERRRVDLGFRCYE
jgi:hypothetical protein